MPKYYINKMNELGLLKKEGFMLDLGCGNGADSEYFKNLGYTVTSVDIKSPYVNALKADIQDFSIKKGKYDVIICNNVLPFIAEKEIVKAIILRISEGLSDSGIACLSVFGPDDAWSSHKEMSFFTSEEISAYLKSIGMTVIEKVTTEGLGKTMKGDIKYWHAMRFLLRKAS